MSDHSQRPPSTRKTSRPPPAESFSASWQMVRDLALPSGELPKVVLRSVRRHPLLYRKLIAEVSPAARPGDLVSVWTPQQTLLGHGLYNPRAEITVRLLQHGDEPPGVDWWHARLATAVELRRGLLHLLDSDACRLIHAEADGLSGLVVDRYGDVLSAEVFSLAMYQRAGALLEALAGLCGTRHTVVQVAPQAHGQEGFTVEPRLSPGFPGSVVIEEFGTKFRVEFAGGHKTGFFCDQRENRRRLAGYCAGRTVLDLCCYTGGFALQAKVLGQASEVTAVDLDEKAVAAAQANARLNEARVRCVHADAFHYMRDMLQNGRQYDVVILDPPKLIRSRRELEDGAKTHLDLNRLAVQLVRPGGLFLTCCCSGLLPETEFMNIVANAARQARRPPGEIGGDRIELQLLERSGAAPDHPVSLDCPETGYLKALWFRVLHA